MVNAYLPTSLKEVLTLIKDHRCRFVAGGTDMLIQFHSRSGLPIGFKDDVIYIAHLDELKGITEDEENIYIGAVETLEDIMHHPLTPKLLQDTILEMASPAIRHTGTLAGNIGNASPAGDGLVPLYLLNADIEVKSLENTRIIPIQHFITGVRKIDLHDDEIITRIIINKIDFDKQVFVKVGPRRSDAISKLSFAGAIRIEKDLISDLRFAFGAVNTTVVRHPEIECLYIRQSIKELTSSLPKIIEQYRPFIKPIDDQRSNKQYRETVSLNLLRDFILSL